MSLNTKIEHVVCLVMENQSFDRVLGFVDGVGALDGTQYAVNSSGEKVFVRKGADPIKNQQYDPPHSFAATVGQLFGPEGYKGEAPVGKWFLSAPFPNSDADAEQEFMRFFDSDNMQLPAITTLAQNFITCDRWFSSVPGPTGPNRLFIHAATSGGYAGSSWKLDTTQYTFNSSGEKIPKKGLNCPAEMQTIYESIDHSPGNYNWRYYFHESLNTAMAFPYVRACTQNLKTTEDFFEDAANNNLPSYSFITPHLMVNCQHPGLDGINMVPGDNLIADVYEAIRQNEEVWQKTLLIITYDEAGGYYDSVFSREKVPSTPILNPKGWPEDNVEYDFRYLGVRVPALLISAWFDHCLDHNLYEHSSILTTLKDLFRLQGKGPDGFLTIRDQNSNNLIAHQKIRDIPRTDLQKLPRSKFQNPEIS